MKIKLIYKNVSGRALAGAFIPGGDAGIWLREIDKWGVNISSFQCYILPQSVSHISAGGLFVVFGDAAPSKPEHVFHPYYSYFPDLFLPFDAEPEPILYPKDEKLFRYAVNIWHPAIGLCGFEYIDRLALTDLVSVPAPDYKDWYAAHHGLPETPQLRSISVEEITLESLLKDLMSEIQSHSITEIKDEDRYRTKDKIIDFFRSIYFRLIIWLFRNPFGLFKIKVPAEPVNISPVSDAPGVPGASKNTGLAKRLQDLFSQGRQRIEKHLNYSEKTMEEIRRRRESEIERLLRLFDNNMKEALQYALPINDEHLGRGISNPGWQLSKRLVNFSLSGLGGGKNGDYWDIGSHRYTLQQKYYEAAEKAKKENDHRTAAYIYAHLLKNFQMAATALEQGGYYREAAAIYKDHLNDTTRAAQSLETGGYLLDAIPLYISMSRNKKAGDLYQQAGMDAEAREQWQIEIDKLLARNNYYEAGEILAADMLEKEKARETYLKGWDENSRADQCLQAAFGLIDEADHTAVNEELALMQQKHVNTQNEFSWLNALVQFHKKYQAPEIKETVMQMSFRAVSRQTAAGNKAALHRLKQILPEDFIIGPDISLYLNKQDAYKNTTKPVQRLRLRKDVVWKKAVSWKNQLLALGNSGNDLILARANWQGAAEYYGWAGMMCPAEIYMANSPEYSSQIIVYSGEKHILKNIQLPANRNFDDELMIGCPMQLPDDLVSLCPGINSDIIMLRCIGNDVQLSEIKLDGTAVGHQSCMLENQQPLRALRGISDSEIQFRNGGSYFWREYMISKTGVVSSLATQRVYKAAYPNTNSPLRAVFLTSVGLVIYEEGKPINEDSYFGTDDLAENMLLIQPNYLATSFETDVNIYNISGTVGRHMHTIKCQERVISIVSTYKRDSFAIVLKTGEVIVHQVEE